MELKCFPFTSEVTYDVEGKPKFDRAVDSKVLRTVYKNYWTDGVFAITNSNSFRVSAPSSNSMSVVVQPGACQIQGACAYSLAEATLVIAPSDAMMPRIDSVVLRLDDNLDFRNIRLYVIKGTAATEPAAPALVREGSIFDIGLANVYVGSNATAIKQINITDTRPDANRCGYVSAVNTLDTTGIYRQYQDSVDQILTTMSSALDGTLAGNIQNQLNTISTKVTTNQTTNQAAIDSLSTKVNGIKPTTISATLVSTGWTNKVYKLAVPGVVATSIVDVLPILVSKPSPTTSELAMIEAFNALGLKDAGQEPGFIYLYTDSVPAINVQIRVIVRGA